MHDQNARNRRRSLTTMAAFALITALVVAVVAWSLGAGPVALPIAIAAASAATWSAHRLSDAAVLKLSRAVEADATTYARYHNVVEGLCVAGGTPKPRLYVIDDAAPNALVTGRDPKHTAMALTTGLIDQLDRVELEAVAAHELVRLKNHDAISGTLAVTTFGLVTLAADGLVRLRWWNGGRLGRDDRQGGAAPPLGAIGIAILSLAPLLARFLELASAPRGGSDDDLSAVALTRYPPGLTSALEKLAADSTVVHAGARATSHLWMASPLATSDEEGHLAGRNRAFDTRPPLGDRIAALREL